MINFFYGMLAMYLLVGSVFCLADIIYHTGVENWVAWVFCWWIIIPTGIILKSFDIVKKFCYNRNNKRAK